RADSVWSILRLRLLTRARNLNQGIRVRLVGHFGSEGLFAAPKVEIGNVMDAADRAVGRAGLLGKVFAADVLPRVLIQRLGRITTLLGAIVDQAVLADVHVAGAGPATPTVGPALSDGVLEEIQAGVMAVFERLHLLINLALMLA